MSAVRRAVELYLARSDEGSVPLGEGEVKIPPEQRLTNAERRLRDDLLHIRLWQSCWEVVGLVGVPVLSIVIWVGAVPAGTTGSALIVLGAGSLSGWIGWKCGKRRHGIRLVLAVIDSRILDLRERRRMINALLELGCIQ
jgi:hypothetical protein